MGKAYTNDELNEYISGLGNAFLNLGAVPRLDTALSDPKDEPVVSAAIYGQADYLVSGDKKHILPLKDHFLIKKAGIAVVSPREFLEILKEKILSK